MKNENTNAKNTEIEAVEASKDKTADAVSEIKDSQQETDASVEAKASDAGISGADVIESSEINNDESNEIDSDDEENEEDAVYLTLERESFKGRDKRRYWSYYVSGVVYPGTRFEKKVKASFTPSDNGGYELLDMMFEMSDKVLLDYSIQNMKNESTGLKTLIDIFMAFVIDPYGNKLEYKLKPYEKSDLAIFKMLYQEEKNKLKENHN